jgi:hypothetical protein
MYLIGQGIAKHIFEMLTVSMGKDYNKAINIQYKPTEEEMLEAGCIPAKEWRYSFYIHCKDLIKVGKLVEASRATIPTTFASKWENPIVKSGGKRSFDWIDILLYMVPTLFVPELKQESSRRPVLALVNAAAVSLKWELHHEDLAQMEK